MTPQETRAYLESRQSDAPKRFDLTCAPTPFGTALTVPARSQQASGGALS